MASASHRARRDDAAGFSRADRLPKPNNQTDQSRHPDTVVNAPASANSGGKELSISQAADVLNYDPPHVRKLIERNEIPHRMVGGQHRLSMRDVLEYGEMNRAKRRAALDELVALSQEMNLYDIK